MSLATLRKRLRGADPPPNYVAGLGRGAVGFTTRSDIGPARLPSDPTFGKNPPNYVAGRGRGMGGASTGGHEDEDGGPITTSLGDDEVGLFAGGVFDADDDEADAIYDAIDERMDGRRKDRRDKFLKEQQKMLRSERPKIQQQFAKLKQELSVVSAEEWDAITDPGDISHKNKKQRYERYTPAPTSLLEQARLESQINTTLDRRGGLTSSTPGLITPGLVTPGFATPGFTTPGVSSVQDLTKVGEAKQTIMRAKLVQASDSVTGQTSINPKGYLTDLSSVKLDSAAEVGDREHALKLFESVTSANPTHAPAWIALARLEEKAGKLARARKVIMQGCDNCSKNEDIWLEAARLNNPDEARSVLAQAVRFLPTSVKIWTKAAKLEADMTRKKRVLRKALENIPNSPALWKLAVSLESPEDAKLMLYHAVECIPSSVEMWLALAKLETYDNAKRVLNDAQRHIPTERSIWITAAQLEEANGNEEAVHKVIRKAVKTLAKHGVQVEREEWLTEAENCEKAGSIITCQAIVMETVGLGVDDEDRKATWIEDSENMLGRASVQTARAILAHATSVFPGKQSLWLRIAQLEKKHGDNKTLEEVLKKSVRYCIKSEILWLMLAKHKWQTGDVKGAQEVLAKAFDALPGSEKIVLAAVKLEKENDGYDLARMVLERARTSAPTERIWMKSALLERELGNTEAEKKLILTGGEKFPKHWKFYCMLAQLYEYKNNDSEAREIYLNGLKECVDCIPLWIGLARLEERTNGMSRARAILEKARLKNPQNADLWLEAIRVEARGGEQRIAFNMLAKALQECPKSGTLWAEAIEMESRAAKKARSVDALKRCDQDPHVILAVAKLFWSNRQLDKARTWFNRAISSNPDFGDAWATLYKFEMQHGNPEQQQDVISRCVQQEPHHGEKWISVSKNPKNAKLKTEQILVNVAQKIHVDVSPTVIN